MGVSYPAMFPDSISGYSEAKSGDVIEIDKKGKPMTTLTSSLYGTHGSMIETFSKMLNSYSEFVSVDTKIDYNPAFVRYELKIAVDKEYVATMDEDLNFLHVEDSMSKEQESTMVAIADLARKERILARGFSIDDIKEINDTVSENTVEYDPQKGWNFD